MSRPRTAQAPVVGLALLITAFAVARHVLPEWASEPSISPFVVRSLVDRLEKVGGRLSSIRPAFAGGGELVSSYETAYRLLGREGARYLVGSGGAVATAVRGQLFVKGAGAGRVEIRLAPDGTIRSFAWKLDQTFAGATPDAATVAARGDFLAKVEGLVVGSSRRTGEELPLAGREGLVQIFPLVKEGDRPQEALYRMGPTGAALLVERELHDPGVGSRLSLVTTRFLSIQLVVCGACILGVLVLFGVLLHRRHLSFRIAVPLGVAALATLLVTGNLVDLSGSAVIVVFSTLWQILIVAFLVALWAAAESVFRSSSPDSMTSLDGLSRLRLGPRAGRAIVGGLGFGASIAAGRLLALSLAAALAPAVRPERSTLSLPFFGGLANPFVEGPYEAATVLLAVAGVRYLLSGRNVWPVAVVGIALLQSTFFVASPWAASFAVALVEGALVVLALRAHGPAGLLVAAASAALFRDALGAAHLFEGNLLPLLLTLASLGGLAACGIAGLGRAEREDEARLDAPEYIRRLESERRVKQEMDLFTRMQLSLLPERPPVVPGLELAVKMVLATEAGGDLYDFHVDEDAQLWVAAGDVAGHGYSCGIQQAMVKAALVSLVRKDRSPAEILGEVDRVLRTSRGSRLFTSLTLLRIDPSTGRGLLANAGHPFPILLEEGRTREIVTPGFPLGQGPKRTYRDVPIEIAKGGTLLLSSDGLFEGPDAFDAPYGYERPHTVLTSVGLWRRPVDAIVEALYADYRLHIGEGAPADDTTLVAVRRLL